MPPPPPLVRITGAASLARRRGLNVAVVSGKRKPRFRRAKDTQVQQITPQGISLRRGAGSDTPDRVGRRNVNR